MLLFWYVNKDLLKENQHNYLLEEINNKIIIITIIINEKERKRKKEDLLAGFYKFSYSFKFNF